MPFLFQYYFATFSYLDIISLLDLLPFLISILFCYLFLFGYYISVILLPFLISLLFCYLSYLDIISLWFVAFSYFNTILLPFLFGYLSWCSKMFDMIWLEVLKLDGRCWLKLDLGQGTEDLEIGGRSPCRISLEKCKVPCKILQDGLRCVWSKLWACNLGTQQDQFSSNVFVGVHWTLADFKFGDSSHLIFVFVGGVILYVFLIIWHVWWRNS